MGEQQILKAVKEYFRCYAASTCDFDDLAPWCSRDRLGPSGCEAFMKYARDIADGLAPGDTADEVRHSLFTQSELY